MKKINQLIFSYSLIFIYILGCLIPFQYNQPLPKQNLNLTEQENIKNNSKYLKDNGDNDGNDKKEDFREDNNRDKYDEGKNKNNTDFFDEKELEKLNSQLKDLDSLIKEQEFVCRKNKIYLILLIILASILFLVIVIYSSIKCYILCSSKRDIEADYLISKISLNKFGQVYMSENDDEKFKKSNNDNLADYGAPIYANNNNNQYNTFNPDNCIPSEQDKKLYKPYNNEDMN